MVLNEDMTPRGFALRDHEGIPAEKGSKYLETYTWFYRYHVIAKVLNAMTFGIDTFYPPPGGPIQFGQREELRERFVHSYIAHVLKNEASPETQEALANLSLPLHEYDAILTELDNAFVNLLSRYFDVERSGILNQGNLPAAENGSVLEEEMIKHNRNLWNTRFGSVKQHPALLQPIKPFRKEEILVSCSEFANRYLNIPNEIDKKRALHQFTGHSDDFWAYVQNFKSQIHADFMAMY
jgi:hypothetical protein